jgi:sialic acid synthase SpsE
MKNKISVANKVIGGNAAFVVAEIGSNHNQSLDLAYETINAAADSGADAVKFQSIKIEELYFNPAKNTRELHKKIDLDEKWHRLLHEHCKKKGIIFFSTPTYLKAVDILESLDIPLYKVASAQIGTFPQLVSKVASTGKPVIFSTGIVTSPQLDEVIKLFKTKKNDQFIILHCNSIYPTPVERVYLPVMADLREKYGCIVGFSDHTVGLAASIAAVALGAKVIEKHFTLDQRLPVPDAAFSLGPTQFRDMVDGIRAVEQMMLESTRHELQQEEAAFKAAILTRLVSNSALKKGHKLKVADFQFLRAAYGIDCRDLDSYLAAGATYKRDIEKNTIIEARDVDSTTGLP